MEIPNLEDLIPEGSSFTLRLTGKTYQLRPATAADEIWMRKKFKDRFEQIFREASLEEICQIAFHLMQETDQQEFLAREVSFVNEEGERAKHTLGGANLFMCRISGPKEKRELFQAVLGTIGISRKIIGEALPQKKTEVENLPEIQTGETSSTDSLPSTDGQPSTSSVEHSEKSDGDSAPLESA